MTYNSHMLSLFLNVEWCASPALLLPTVTTCATKSTSRIWLALLSFWPGLYLLLSIWTGFAFLLKEEITVYQNMNFVLGELDLLCQVWKPTNKCVAQKSHCWSYSSKANCWLWGSTLIFYQSNISREKVFYVLFGHILSSAVTVQSSQLLCPKEFILTIYFDGDSYIKLILFHF